MARLSLGSRRHGARAPAWPSGSDRGLVPLCARRARPSCRRTRGYRPPRSTIRAAAGSRAAPRARLSSRASRSRLWPSRLRGSRSRASAPGSPWPPASSAPGLCATVGFPGVIDQADLDARPVNALAGAGALLALGLTAAALRRGGIGASARFQRSDWLQDRGRRCARPRRASLDLGGARLLRRRHAGDRRPVHRQGGHAVAGRRAVAPRRPPGTPPRARRDPPRPRRRSCSPASRPACRGKREGTALAVYVALLLTYGLANALQDGWNEQLVKRGTFDAKLPSVIRPDLSPAWLGIVLGAAAIYFLLFRVGRVNRPEGVIR